MRRERFPEKVGPSIWDREDDWPFDTPTHVFVTRAAQHLRSSTEKPVAEARREIALTIREHCAWGRLRAALQYHDGTVIPIPAERWNTHDFRDWLYSGQIPSTQVFRDHHPLAAISYYWIMIERSGLAALVSANASETDIPTSAKRGPGAPSLKEDDLPAVVEMRRLIESGEASSVSRAAQIVRASGHVVGSGKAESIEKRLERRYSKQFGSE